MLPKPHALFSEETFEFWDFFHTICKMIVISKKGTRKISNDIIFRIRFNFSRKNYIEYFLVCYTFCFIQTHMIETNEVSSSESLQSLLMKPLMTTYFNKCVHTNCIVACEFEFLFKQFSKLFCEFLHHTTGDFSQW